MPSGKVPRLGLDLAFLLDAERELHARQQHGLGAQQRGEVRRDDRWRVEVLGVGPEANARAGIPRARGAGLLERLLHLAVVGEHDAIGGAVALYVHLQPLGQRIAHAHAHTVQAARDAISRVLVGLAELAARMQRGEDHLHRRDLLLRVDVDGNAAPVVFHRRRSVLVQNHRDLAREPGQALVRRVVDHLHQRVIGVDRIGVHPRPVQDRRQILKNLDVFGGIPAGFPGHCYLA